MPLFDQLVATPSIEAVIYQAHVLIRKLNSIANDDYPPQAWKIRDACLCFAQYILEQLCEIHAAGAGSGNKTVHLNTATAERVTKLGKGLQDIHSYIRYLQASSPDQSPPAIQVALTQLTKSYLPNSGQEAESSVCLVRPQWKYNLTYVPIVHWLNNLLDPSVLNPSGQTLQKSEHLLQKLWERYYDEAPPKQLGILSFAGLDTHDTLLYPLLAHELGHYIDFSHQPPLNLKSELQEFQIKPEDVSRILNQEDWYVAKACEICMERVSICWRELIADLLAVRMMGFSFFVALAEFLKTLFPWTEEIVTESGYPSINFRLYVVFKHLEKMNVRSFWTESSQSFPDESSQLLDYLNGWEQFLQGTAARLEGKPKPSETLDELVERAVVSSLDTLGEIVQRVIPDDGCASMSQNFFERISRLKHELPPLLPNENSQQNCFAELMSASWAYQILFGEGKEREIALTGEIKAKRRDSSDLFSSNKLGYKGIPLPGAGKFDEYSKTCRLILKAIELIRKAQETPPLEPGLSEPPTQEEIRLEEKGGVLSSPHILRRISLPHTHPSHLAVIPFNEGAINGASLEVHLGNWFVFARRSKLTSVNMEKDRALLRAAGREEVFVPYGQTFLIHPNDLVLGVTLEFLALPLDIMASVEGKSGIGRLGLFIATATQIAPGFHGSVVLELVNAGTIPLEVVSGMPIAQLILQTTTTSASAGYSGGFHCQIKP